MSIQEIIDELLSQPKQTIAIFVENGQKQKQVYHDAYCYAQDRLFDSNARSAWLELDTGTRIEFWCRSVSYHKYQRHDSSYDRVIDL